MKERKVSSPNYPGTAGQFAETRWSMVLRARDLEKPEAADALELLCRTYWPVIYGFLRRKGIPPADAQDRAQGFFEGLLRRNGFAGADPAKGRFRTYLLSALTNYLADERDRAHAQKRGGGVATISIDEQNLEGGFLAEPSTDDTPEKAFDRRWATALLEGALRRLHAEFTAARKENLFQRFRIFLTQEAEPGGYDMVAAELGLKPGTVAVTVHRMRGRYRELLREEVAHTVSNPAEVDDEIRALFLGN